MKTLFVLLLALCGSAYAADASKEGMAVETEKDGLVTVTLKFKADDLLKEDNPCKAFAAVMKRARERAEKETLKILKDMEAESKKPKPVVVDAPKSIPENAR